MTWVASGRTSTSLVTSSNGTPRHGMSNFDHLVTQWMSTTTSTAGSASTSSHDSVWGSVTRPPMRRPHCERSSYSGTLPAWSTGKRSVKYWPGGRRAGSTPRSASALRLRSKKLIGRSLPTAGNQGAGVEEGVLPALVGEVGEGAVTGGVCPGLLHSP